MKKQNAGIATVIFVGSGYDKDNTRILPVERDGIRQRILAKAAEVFGGVTIVDAHGAWVDDAGKMVEERVFQVIVYVRRPDREYIVRLTGFIRFILSVSRQTSILVDDRVLTEAYLVFASSLAEDVTAHG